MKYVDYFYATFYYHEQLIKPSELFSLASGQRKLNLPGILLQGKKGDFGNPSSRQKRRQLIQKVIYIPLYGELERRSMSDEL